MSKKGFTLIELLAVIVILAIIALIATPIVLSIIDDTKKSSMLRSAEMYLNGVENSIMKENMNTGGKFRPNECTITSEGNLYCEPEDVFLEIEVDGEKPKNGTIVFENGKIKEVTLNYESGTIIKDESGNLVYEGSVNKSICTLASDSTVAEGLEGAKYNCKVDPNKPEYTFYLLDNNEDGTSDLIMNANINASGEAVIPVVIEDIVVVSWNTEEYKNINGPIIAMEYLYNATKSWTNVEPLNYEYYDRQVQGITDPDNGYESFVSKNGIAVITKGDADKTQATIGSEIEPLRARMPIYSRDASVTEVSNRTDSNSFLYENVVRYEYGYYGYWTMSSVDNFDWMAVCNDEVNWGFLDYSGIHGVRPVITLKM